MHTRGWSAIADLIEEVAGDPALLSDVVEEVRSSIREVSGLEASDVARHTRALLAASTRAIASRRGPTEPELSFVEDLAVTRARQGVPVHAVLSAIHVAERRIWVRARAVADEAGVDPVLVLEARELYDDWAQEVRERLLLAHRSAEADGTTGAADRETALLRRLLQGGSAAALAAAEADLLRGGTVAVLVAVGPPLETRERLLAGLRGLRGVVAGRDGADVVAVVRGEARHDDLATGLPELPAALGLAGPGLPEAVPVLRRLAGSASRAAAARGRVGVVPVTDIAGLTALQERADLAAALVDRHLAAVTGLGRVAEPTVHTVRTWLEWRCDADRAAEALFVHPNTVRNRVAALTRATGIDPRDPFQAVDLWWLCSTWMARYGEGPATPARAAGRAGRTVSQPQPSRE